MSHYYRVGPLKAGIKPPIQSVVRVRSCNFVDRLLTPQITDSRNHAKYLRLRSCGRPRELLNRSRASLVSVRGAVATRSGRNLRVDPVATAPSTDTMDR